MLQLKGIYKTFNAGTVNEKRAIDNLNLTLEDGDFVTIIGGNGAGKSTTLNLIAGVYPVDAGMIHLNGYDLTNLPEHKRARFLGQLRTEVYNPKTVFLHAALLHQGFPHCAIFPTAASRRSLGRVSVPMWPFNLSVRLLIVDLVGRYPTNYLIRREPILRHLSFGISIMR